MIQEETPYKTPYTEEEVNVIVRQNEELRKKYDNALEKAEKIYHSEFKPDEAAVLSKYLPILFPELKKESEDEKIKREIVAYINELADLKNEKIPTKWLTWLEKQGEIKTTDKIEPKFKPGDCISNGRYMKKIIDINNDWSYYMFQDGSSYRIKEVDTKWHIMPNIDELEWMNVHTDEDHCYSCELFDRKNNMCKCLTLCKDPHNIYKGFYVK